MSFKKIITVIGARPQFIKAAMVSKAILKQGEGISEEINRVVSDHLSSLLFCPTKESVKNLEKEGINEGVLHVGDVMYDAAQVFGEIAERESQVLTDLRLKEKHYILVTVHRAENIDNLSCLKEICQALGELAQENRVVFPAHPRTRKAIAENNYERFLNGVDFLEPISFFDMIQLEKNALAILTDSGGVQKEAYFHGVPCITLRKETEWVETVDAGWNQVVGANCARILAAMKMLKSGSCIVDYGEGKASQIITKELIKVLDL